MTWLLSWSRRGLLRPPPRSSSRCPLRPKPAGQSLTLIPRDKKPVKAFGYTVSHPSNSENKVWPLQTSCPTGKKCRKRPMISTALSGGAVRSDAHEPGTLRELGQCTQIAFIRAATTSDIGPAHLHALTSRPVMCSTSWPWYCSHFRSKSGHQQIEDTFARPESGLPSQPEALWDEAVIVILVVVVLCASVWSYR